MLFSDRSVWTMAHGLVLSGGALMATAAALFALVTMSVPAGAAAPERQSRALAWLLLAVAVLLWLSVLSGTYLIFPLYRATPPEGALLAAYPRALLLSSPDTSWGHAFAMEIKEHLPWMAAMLATAVAFIGTKDRGSLLADPPLRAMTVTVLGIVFALVSGVALLGVFVNKLAPLQ